jgi:pSer/pThr/pTyr-binding forkhead associated (FHA) protein/tetratricopeptide (TPR) repeat protein
MNKLVIQDDEGKTTVVPLIREEITIGRKEGNTIRLTERNVSRRHARILRQNASVQIEDLDSYNGVRVNGSRIQGRCPLSLSDRVQIGDYLIELKSDEAAAMVGADGYGESRTQPMERVDPMAATPTPMPPERGQPTAVVSIDRIQGTPVPPSFPQAVAMADTDPSGAAVHAAHRVEHPARLVVLSANFAGRDFDLTKPAMVIGRTDDNDIVINHRSISRHHAKIVQENGRFAIVDLQSSNGVRVNGEEYGKVELRRGDMIDLGHVRMRFVEVGEDFVFGRDAQVVDVTPKSKKGLVFALVALVVVGGGIAVLATSGGGDEEKQPAVASGGGDQKPVTPPAPAVVPDAATAAPPAADTGAGAKLAEARAAFEKSSWEEARRLANEALALDPANAAAQALVEKAGREIENAARYRQFIKAADAKDYAKVASLFSELDNDSFYREEARDTHDSLRDEFVAKTEAQAKELVRTNKCANLPKLEEKAGAVWPEAGAVVAAQRAICDQRVAVKDPPTNGKKPPDDKKPPPGDDDDGGSAVDPSAAGKTAAQLTEEARVAAKTGQFGKAIRLCESALALDKNDQDAAMVCVIASCNLKNVSKAKKYIGKLRSDSRKGMARQICLKQGVKVD